jgi:hypothetical protein
MKTEAERREMVIEEDEKLPTEKGNWEHGISGSKKRNKEYER